MNSILVSRDSKGKIRVASLHCEWNDDEHGYIISRETGQLNGKMTQQPNILIQRGKASRTVTEQAKLEFNSHLKKYLDKGYKALEGELEDYTEEQINELIGDNKTDQNGFAKHMLAKQADKVAQSTIDKVPYWYASRKIDGVRASFYYKDGEIHTASRGGGHYDYSTRHFRENSELLAYFEKHPGLVLDGELYKHGKSLQQISGAARLEKNAYDCDWLEYYIYDIMIPEKFEIRLADLQCIASDLHLGFDPEREWKEGELQMQMVPQIKVSKLENINKLHDEWVAEGWEGCVIRDPSKEYKFGGRGNEMIKVKHYQDSEFEITGISEGLREEDMCFTLVTEDGIEFKAKPMGSRELKQQYREDLDKLIGKMATVKYFYLSDEGTPLQPVLKAIRDYE